MLRLAVVVLVLVAGCGGGDDETAAGDLRVEVSYDDPLRPGDVTWEVTVVNGTADDVTLEFPNGQRAEVRLQRDGRDVYQWSREQMFTQELGEEVVPAGSEVTFELDDVLEVDPGDYRLLARVTSSTRTLRAEAEVTVATR